MENFAREEDIRRILSNTKRIAVVGLSPKPHRSSHGVSQYMQLKGYTIIPVNPGYDKILGELAYPDLSSIPDPFETVNVFRNPKFVMPHIDEAIELGAKHLWLQEGVIHLEGAQKAQEAGIVVVMDRCIYKEHRRLGAYH